MRSLFTYQEEYVKFVNNLENHITTFIEKVRDEQFDDPQKLLKPILTEDKTYRLDNYTKRYLLSFEGSNSTNCAVIYIKY